MQAGWWLSSALVCTLLLGPYGSHALARNMAGKEFWLGPFTIEERSYLAINTARERAWDAAEALVVRGPAVVNFDMGELALPPGVVFVPIDAARPLLETYGIIAGPAMRGFATDSLEEHRWIVTIRSVRSDFPADEIGEMWTAPLLERRFALGVNAANAAREVAGLPTARWAGWADRPRYDPASHRLTYAVLTKSARRPEGYGRDLAATTLLFGSRGYFAVDLLTSEARAATDRPLSQAIIDGLRFPPDEELPAVDTPETSDDWSVESIAGSLGEGLLLQSAWVAGRPAWQAFWLMCAVAATDAVTREGVSSFGPLRNPRPIVPTPSPASPRP